MEMISFCLTWCLFERINKTVEIYSEHVTDTMVNYTLINKSKSNPILIYFGSFPSFN